MALSEHIVYNTTSSLNDVLIDLRVEKTVVSVNRYILQTQILWHP